MAKGQLREDLKNPWLRGVLAIVAVTLLANVVFISLAFISSPNLVVKDYYEQGKEYFHAQVERDEIKQLGYRLHLMAPATPKLGIAQPYRLYVVDPDGKPWNRGEGTLFAYRPNDASKDFQQPLLRSDTGMFAAEVNFPMAGNWDLIAQIYVDNKKLDVAQRVFVEK